MTSNVPLFSKSTRAERARKKKDDEGQKSGNKKGGCKKEKENAVTEADVKAELNKGQGGRRTPLHARDMEGDESYSHIMGNNHWYILHIQGDHSGCVKPPVDIKLKFRFSMRSIY